MALLDHLKEGAQQPDADLVGAVIVVAVLREVALDLEAGGKTHLVAHDLDLGVLDGAQGPIFPENSSPNAFPFTSMSDMTNVSLDEISIVKPTGVSSKWR